VGTRGYSVALAGGRQRRNFGWVGTSRVLTGTARVAGVHGGCGTAEGGTCAGAYLSGDRGSNECPAGSVRIEAEAACRTAAAAAGKTFGSTSVNTDYPRGCYIWTDDNNAYFNTHSVGAGAPDARLLCTAVTTGAPAPLNDARACTHRWVQRRFARVRIARARLCVCCGRSAVLRRHVGARKWARESGEGIVRHGSDGGAVRCGRWLCVYVRRVLDATARFGMDGCT
jgi:hypothetical protein